MNTRQKTGFFGEEGARLYYEVAGNGPALLLIHAGIADSGMWDEQFALFAEHYRVIRYDVRGYGKTEVGTRPFYYHEDVFNLLRHLEVEQAFVLGASFGARIALDFTLAHPERVAALILVAPSVGGTKPSELVKQFGAAEDEYLKHGDLDGATELNLRMWVDGPQRTPEQVSPEVRERVRQMQLHAFTIPFPPEAEELSLTPPAIERLAEVHVPTLLLVGDADIPDKLVLVEELARKIEGARSEVIPGVAHMPSMEKPLEFNRAVLQFLEDVKHQPTS